MNIGDVIRKHRKAKNMTQEELATWLGVTAPAVNKWENGNTMPDIMLLAPIARLLDVSLDELLSFRESLTEQEITEIAAEMNRMLLTEDYETLYRFARAKIERYPNCEMLLLSLAALLFYARQIKTEPDKERHDDYIVLCYERLLKSEDEKMKLLAANFLFDYYFGQGQYDRAQSYLSYLSEQNPQKKKKQATLYEKTGQLDKAYRAYEELLYTGYQTLFAVFFDLCQMAKNSGDLEKFSYYTKKRTELIRLFEMGEYNVLAAELELAQYNKDADKTLECVGGLLNSVSSLYSFGSSPLYSHLNYKNPGDDVTGMVGRQMLENFRRDEGFGYMRGDPRWETLLGGDV